VNPESTPLLPGEVSESSDSIPSKARITPAISSQRLVDILNPEGIKEPGRNLFPDLVRDDEVLFFRGLLLGRRLFEVFFLRLVVRLLFFACFLTITVAKFGCVNVKKL
jgi:hypothetical protein